MTLPTFLKMRQPRPLFRLFSANLCEKMSIQYTVPTLTHTTLGT